MQLVNVKQRRMRKKSDPQLNGKTYDCDARGIAVLTANILRHKSALSSRRFLRGNQQGQSRRDHDNTASIQ